MTENQNTNQELSFTRNDLTNSMQTFIDMKENSIYYYKGLTQQEIVCLVLTEFLAFTNKEQDKKNQRYQEYLKLKAEFEGTETAPFVKKESPWYPDDSGEWVEVEPNTGQPLELDDSDWIEFLPLENRMKKVHGGLEYLAGRLVWEEIVAYKKVR